MSGEKTKVAPSNFKKKKRPEGRLLENSTLLTGSRARCPKREVLVRVATYEARVMAQVERIEEPVLARPTAHPPILHLNGRKNLSLKDGWKARRRSRDASAEHPAPLEAQVQAASSERQGSCCSVAPPVQLRGQTPDFYQFRRLGLRGRHVVWDRQSVTQDRPGQAQEPRER